MAKFTILTDDKPALDALLKSDVKKAKEIIGTFVELMEEAAQEEWHTLPGKFSPELSFKDLIKGILHGSLDLRGINPEAVDVLQEEVHPLSMLAPRKNYLDGGVRYTDWRKHFRLPPGAEVNQGTIAKIFRRLLRYYRYVDIEALANALINNRVKTFEGLGERNVQTLPFMPALRYQQKHFGDLAVGKFYDDIGAFDLGDLPAPPTTCPACGRPDIEKLGKYYVCMACNGGFRVKEG